MKKYVVLTAIHGLLAVGRARHEPVEPGEVVPIPDRLVADLIAARAIEPTDAEPTVELASDDFALRLSASAASQPDGASAAPSLDRAALVAAAAALGATVVFPGEPLDEIAPRLSNAELVREMVDRVVAGRLPRWEIPGVLAPVPAADADAEGGAATAAGDAAATEGDAAQAEGDAAEGEAAAAEGDATVAKPRTRRTTAS